MTEIHADFVKLFVQKFTEIHQFEPRQACIKLISAFVTCFSVMAPEERMKCISAFGLLLQDINLEVFEDGQDFASFMKEKAEEHRIKGDFKYDEDANSQ